MKIIFMGYEKYIRDTTILTFIYDNAYCYLYSLKCRITSNDIHNLRIWITTICLAQIWILSSFVMWFLYMMSIIALYKIMRRIEEAFDIDVQVPRNIIKSDVIETPEYVAILGEWDGRRPYMEDRTVKIPSKNIFGIFDGHGGSFTSSFLASNFERIHYINSFVYSDGDALRLTLRELEELIEETEMSGGSTGIIVKFDHDKIISLSVGDSEAWSWSPNVCRPISHVHSFGRFEEYRRYALGVKSLGESMRISNVIRTMTGLMPTRTIGDFKHKQNDPFLLSEPEILESCENWDIIVIGSDGIFDGLNMRRITDEMRRAKILIENDGEITFDTSDILIDVFMRRLQMITSKSSGTHDKIANIYGGDNCSICIIIKK